VPRSTLADGKRYELQGAIWSEGRPSWVTDPVPVTQASGIVELGTINVTPYRGGGAFATTLRCGDQEAILDYTQQGTQLKVGGETFDMRQVSSASGAKYEAVNDSTTIFWSKGPNALVTARGRQYPECQPAGSARQVFRARGNEPGWSLEDVVVTISDRPCADDMSGMPYPETVVVQQCGRELRGCGGDPASLLKGKEWVVEDMDGKGIIDNSRASLNFGDDGRLYGRASCNTYSAKYTLTSEGLTVTSPVTTEKACAPSLMQQEDRFLEVLRSVQRFEIDSNGALILHGPPAPPAARADHGRVGRDCRGGSRGGVPGRTGDRVPPHRPFKVRAQQSLSPRVSGNPMIRVTVLAPAILAAILAATPAAAQGPIDFAKLVPAKDSFVVLLQGKPVGYEVITLDRSASGFVIKDDTSLPPRMQQHTEVTIGADGAMTSVTQRGVLTGREMKVDVAYAGARVTGSATTPGPAGAITTKEVSAEIPLYTVDDNVLLPLLPGVAWQPGLSIDVPLFSSGQNTLYQVTLTVVGTVSVKVPAGTFEAWKVSVKGLPQAMTVYVSTVPPHRVLKAVSEGAPLEFVAAR
jgi:heat shock protein HslJ